MDFRGRDVGEADRYFAQVKKGAADFGEADRRFAEAKRRFEAGSISDEVFDAERQRSVVQDSEGRWWAKGKTGEWNYHDGNAWVRGTPPIDRPEPSVEAQPEQAGPSPRPRATSALVQKREKQRRWLVLSILGVMMASILGMGGIVATAPAYAPVEGDSGNLSVEVPSEWKDHITDGADPEGEKGKTWSSFLGEDAGPSITAINDFEAWRTGARPHKGVYMVASRKLAQKYTDDELVAAGPNDYSASCKAGARQDFDRSPYSGKIQEWTDCGGESDHTARTLAAAPQGRECVILLQIGGYLKGDEEAIQHILDTFEADCGSIE